MALQTDVLIQVSATLSKALDLANPSVPLAYKKTLSLASGTGLNQADKIFHDQRSTSGTDTLDLAGVLTDALGDAFTLARLKGLVLVAAVANTGDLRITRPAANGAPLFGAASDYLVLRPGGVFAWFAPDATAIALTGGTADLLDIVSAGGSQTYDVIIIGASA